MISTRTLAHQLSSAAAAYCPAEAARLPDTRLTKEERRVAAIEIEKRNTARLRNEAFEAQKDERQIGLL